MRRPVWVAWMATAILAAVSCLSLARHASEALALAQRGPIFNSEMARRFDPLMADLQASDMLIGYALPAEAFVPYAEGVQDPAVRLRVDRLFVRYQLAQQALAPRILVLPSHPLYAHVKLVVADYEDPAAMPALEGTGFERVAVAQEGVELWRRQ